jgi:GTPase SAR1 family protein
MNGKEHHLEILDSYEDITDLNNIPKSAAKLFEHASGFMLVYSISTRSSFEQVEKLAEQLVHLKDFTRHTMFIIGNKSDLEQDRVVSKEEGEALANKFQMKFREVSAKDDVNIQQTFDDFVLYDMLTRTKTLDCSVQ